MRRFFVNSKAINNGTVTVTGSDVHHIRDVIRLQPGARIICIDESATEHVVMVSTIEKDQVTGKIEESRAPGTPTIDLALFQGLPKGTKFDEIIEKTTQLGVNRIAPVLMERTVGRADVADGKRVERWRRVAEAAAKQSRRVDIPQVDEPMTFAQFEEAVVAYDAIILFWEGAEEPIDRALEKFSGASVAVIIGPEGGLATREVGKLIDLGASPAWLGPRILRTETAPIAALAIVNHLLRR